MLGFFLMFRDYRSGRRKNSFILLHAIDVKHLTNNKVYLRHSRTHGINLKPPHLMCIITYSSNNC